MLLQNKNVAIYGDGGAIGSALANALAREGNKLRTGRDGHRIIYIDLSVRIR